MLFGSPAEGEPGAGAKAEPDAGAEQQVLAELEERASASPCALLAPYFRVALQLNPITFIGAHTPAHFIAHGTADTTVPFGQGERLSDALRRAGVDQVLWSVEGGQHNCLPKNSAAWTAAKEEAVEWLVERL